MTKNDNGERNLPDRLNAQIVDEGVIFLDNVRQMSNLSTVRLSYNSLVYCQSGRILIEMGGNRQVRVTPGQMLLIPTGKLIQPMLVSTDVEANVLLVSDPVLRSLLGAQADIWNKAMYMKEIYVIEGSSWVNDLGGYSRVIFSALDKPVLFREIMHSFLRTLLLMICEELIRHDGMTARETDMTTHEKDVFSTFLELISGEEQKRQRVAYYADRLHITPKYLSTVCKRVSGKNPMRWITESVMEDCYNLLLKTDLTVKEIAHRQGFPNASFFGQYFREQAGVTPMEYRTQHRSKI